MKKEEIIQEPKSMIFLIKKELVHSFNKSPEEAEDQIKNANVYQSLISQPIGLHEPPYHWALIVLAKNNDYQTIEKYDH